jgi:pimeloyl-ACP methyl ester carboxylesterase
MVIRIRRSHRWSPSWLLAIVPFGLVGLGLLFSTAGQAQTVPMQANSEGNAPTIVLVHGAWADGSSWSGVIRRLQRDGYRVIAPANPLRSVSSDSAYLASVLATIQGPMVLVGHSYGGMVTTNAATGNANIKALVYIAAFIPDQGDSVQSLGAAHPGSLIVPPGAPGATLIPRPEPTGLDLYIDPAHFQQIFAADLSDAKTAELASAQRPIALAALLEPSGAPAWKTIPTWALFATQDHAIGVADSTFMANRAAPNHTVMVDASHAVLISHPDAVVKLIREADAATR